MKKLKMIKKTYLNLALVIFILFGTSLSAQAELIVSSRFNDILLAFDFSSGTSLGTVDNGGVALPSGVAVGPDGMLYAVSSGNNSVQKYDLSTKTSIGSFVSSGSGGLSGPNGIEFLADGSLVVASTNTNQILRYDGASGAFMGVFASHADIQGPFDLAFGPDGNLYVASQFNDTVVRVDGSTGAYIDTFVSSGSGGLVVAGGIAFGPDGNLYIASRFTDAILQYDGTTGNFIGVFASGNGLISPVGIEFGDDANLYVANFGNNDILRYNGITGALIEGFITAGEGGLSGPYFLAFTDWPVQPDDPATMLEDLISAVDALVDGGLLSEKIGILLKKSLEKAVQKLDSGKPHIVSFRLKTFKIKVGLCVRKGVLPTNEGQKLINAADAIIAVL